MKLGIADRAYKRLDELTIPYLARIRRRRLGRTNFSIISNNCWGGIVYKYYGLPYRSPTVGVYFSAHDYIKLCEDLRGYMALPLEPLDIANSRHCDELIAKGQRDVPLGRLGDLEIVFLHYSTFDEAKEKWERRVARINFDDVFIKFSEMNHCGETELLSFSRLSHRNKLVFTTMPHPDIECAVKFGDKYVEDGQIRNDTVAFRRYIDLDEWLNSEPEPYVSNQGGVLMLLEINNCLQWFSIHLTRFAKTVGLNRCEFLATERRWMA